jgi:membrane fusion protein (multidrug efflux system)
MKRMTSAVLASLPLGLASLVSLPLLLLAGGCSRPEAPKAQAKSANAAPTMKVETADVLHQKMPRYMNLTGSVLPDRQSEVAANVAGRVTATYVERGMPVKQGQVMAVVDSRAAGFQAAAALAQSQVAQTQVQLARQECDRADTLFSQGAIPKAEYDRMKTQCTSQLYQANAAQANADLAGKLAGDTIIRAPIDGIVGERFVNVGEYVQPPSKVASVFAVDPVRISISVPEAAVSQIREGQELMVQVSAWPGREFPAAIRFVSPVLRQNTRDLVVEASAKNPDSALRPGMFAMVKLVVGEEEQPTVPKDAVSVDGTVKRMFLARDGVAFEMVVKTGVTLAGRIAIHEPLQKTDRVIVRPPPGLHDGSPIQ